MNSLLRSYGKLMRSTVKYLYRRKRVEQRRIGGTDDHFRAWCCFLICFFLVLCRETRKHQILLHRSRGSVTVERSGPRHLASVIELKHGVLHGRKDNELRQGVGPASAVR